MEKSTRNDQSAAAFAETLRKHGMNLPVQESLEALKKPLHLAVYTLSNRICIQPLEGYDSHEDGSPSALVHRRYGRFARSGAGLVWFESAAVAEDGKSNPRQMMLSPGRLPDFGSLLEEMDRISLEESGFRQYKVLQMTHSGRHSRGADWTPAPLAARLLRSDPDPHILASDERIHRLIEETIAHAVLAWEAGFDAVDIKACHGYFLGEMLSAFERKGEFGGSFENRTKALLRILDGIREKTGDALDLTVRLNAFDSLPMPEGWGLAEQDGRLTPDLTEPIRLCALLRERGVQIINISASQPRQRLWGKAEDEESLPCAGAWDLLNAVREIREQTPGVFFVSSGLSQFRQFGAAVGAGGIRDGWFDLAGFGRQALAYPDFFREALAGRQPDPSRCCVLCNSCFRLMFPGLSPAGCVIRDPDPYAGYYREHVS